MKQDQDLSTVEEDEREGFISDLSIEEESMQESQFSISECDKLKLASSDLDLDHDDQEYLVLNPMKESSVVEIIWNEEDRFIDPSILISLEQSLHEKVIHSFYEKHDEIFV